MSFIEQFLKLAACADCVSSAKLMPEWEKQASFTLTGPLCYIYTILDVSSAGLGGGADGGRRTAEGGGR